MKYELLISAATRQPWAIDGEKLRVIEHILSVRAAGGQIDADAMAEAMAAKKPNAGRRVGEVALIPIYGTITQRAGMFSDWSGGTSTEAVGQELEAAMADPKTRAVVLDIDSPGGGVYGVEELAVKINAAAKEKKIIAVANSLAASAAYWLGSQASEFVVSPNAEVGSIGVYQLHVDQSEAVTKSGRKVTILSAGERKTAGHPYGPLDEVGQAELQAGVNDYYEKFIRAVARGRSASLKSVREGFGRGGVVRSEEAVKEGMADRIATLDDVLAKYGATRETVARYSANYLRARLMLEDEAVVNAV